MKIKNVLISQPQPAVIEKSPFYEVAKNNVALTFKPFMRIEGVSLKEFPSQRTEIVYRKRKIFFADGKFDSFMELILKHKDERFILALAEPHNPEIPQTLERLKLNFRSLIFAHTVSANLDDVNIKDFDLLVFYSPNEIASLVAKFGTEDIPMIAVLGENTAKAAVEAGLKIYMKAPAPGIPNIAKGIEMLIADAKAGKELQPIEFSHSHKAENFIKAQEAKPAKRSRAKRKPADGTTPEVAAAGAK